MYRNIIRVFRLSIPAFCVGLLLAGSVPALADEPPTLQELMDKREQERKAERAKRETEEQKRRQAKVNTPSPKGLNPADLGIEMMRIPAGEFLMGSDGSDKEVFDNEKLKHKVTVRAFSLAKYEITKGQYAAFVKDQGYYPSGQSCYSYKNGLWGYQPGADWRKPGFPQDDSHPVVCVSLGDALAYIDWLNHKTGQTFRLPTEAEWEYAARAGTNASRFWGDNPDAACRYANVADLTAKQAFSWDSVFNCTDGFAYTAPVGSFQPNAFHLYDMLGNVWEWTCSAYQDKYGDDEKNCISNNHANGRRAVRGGAWYNIPQDVRSANRSRLAPTLRLNNLGFRLAQD